jgi:N-acetylmuramoyl-L-alanine amidase
VLTARGSHVRALRSDTPTPRANLTPTPRCSRRRRARRPQTPAADLATRIQRAFRDRRGSDGDRGVRQDAHHVLLGATMPAALVEVGFIDHPIEGKQLADPAVQAKIADAIVEAIEDQLAD